MTSERWAGNTPDETGQTARQRWLAVLARASTDEIASILERHGGEPAHSVLKAPETGTVMLEGRAGGTGTRFNAGEATVTRCVVRLVAGPIGVAYALGTDRRKALLAALLDGLLQQAASPQSLCHEIGTLAAAQQAKREQASAKAAATKVEFFTLVRGGG
jgi:alpha-D-ribose 1-methylphosphonate 5-triphosphate synthase subunit PhnG